MTTWRFNGVVNAETHVLPVQRQDGKMFQAVFDDANRNAGIYDGDRQILNLARVGYGVTLFQDEVKRAVLRRSSLLDAAWRARRTDILLEAFDPYAQEPVRWRWDVMTVEGRYVIEPIPGMSGSRFLKFDKIMGLSNSGRLLRVPDGYRVETEDGVDPFLTLGFGLFHLLIIHESAVRQKYEETHPKNEKVVVVQSFPGWHHHHRRHHRGRRWIDDPIFSEDASTDG